MKVIYKPEIGTLVKVLQHSVGDKIFITYGYGLFHGVELVNIQFSLQEIVVKQDMLTLISSDPKPQMVRIRVADVVHCEGGKLTIKDDNGKAQTIEIRTSSRGKVDKGIRHLPTPIFPPDASLVKPCNIFGKLLGAFSAN